MMIGAYFFFGLTAQAALPNWAAIVLALIAAGTVGGFLERFVFRRLIGESAISVFMVTIGLASIMVGLVEVRSEERRVGKECRSGWSPDRLKKIISCVRRT